MRCKVCGSDAEPIKVGHAYYCRNCGEKFVEMSDSNFLKKPSMDISSPRRVGAKRMERRPVEAVAPHVEKQETHIPAAPPISDHLTPTKLKHADSRVAAAQSVKRAAGISKFNRAPGKGDVTAAKARVDSVPTLPNSVLTHHEALSRIVQTLPAIHRDPHRNRRPTGQQIASVIAILAIMSGYIWLQNAPKLAVQSAASRAGVSASLPGYMPSSYQLKSTSTAPGLVTVSFESPSSDQPLTITQQHTTWDSSSLLDKFVAKQGNDYTTLSGEGLTVYLFGSNQASWVNHGIWYSITGTGRLGRDQIMKIVYSL